MDVKRAVGAVPALLLTFAAAALAAPNPPAEPTPLAPGVAVETTAPKKHKAPKTKRKKQRSSAKSSRPRDGHVKRSPVDPNFGFSYRSSAALGLQHGFGVRRFDSSLLELSAGWSPWRRVGPLRFELPLEYQQLNLPGGKLAEYRPSASFRVTLRHFRSVQPYAAAEVTAVLRPNWPDLYQPLPNGELLPTERFSYWQRRFEVGAQALLGRSSKARAALRYSLLDYRQDPAFLPVDEPNHLTPSDHQELALKLGLSTALGPVRPRLSLELWQRDYFFVFARDRLTGKTHAGPGGLPPNPLYSLRGAEPELGLTLRLPFGLARAAYGLQLVDDTFQGYYSSVTHHPSLGLRWFATKRLSAELAGELSLRRYGPDSYAASSAHPPLDFGDRRVDRLGSVQLEATWKLSSEWALVANAKLSSRSTNFPDYQPGVFPRSARYDVRWDNDNWRLSLALQCRVRQLDVAD
jgi:hypothetical protein